MQFFFIWPKSAQNSLEQAAATATRGLNIFTGLICTLDLSVFKVRKRAKIRNRYNQVPHLTQDTNGKVTNSQ